MKAKGRTNNAKTVGVGARIRAARKGRALEQRHVATRSGITPEQLSRIENGHMEPRPKTIRHLAEALDVPVETLTGAEGLPSLGARQQVRQRERPRLDGTPAADAVSEGRGE